MKIYLTKGLPGCGKSSWAKQKAEELGNCVIIEKDQIREQMGAVVGENEIRVDETKVIERRNAYIIDALKKGKNIIISDTNLNPVHLSNIKALVFPKYRNYEFLIEDMTDVPVATCIERCASRTEGKEFWEKIIRRLKSQWIIPKKLYEDPNYYLSSLPKCVIFDIDGTLTLMNGRSPYDDHLCFQDLPNYPVIEILKMYSQRKDFTIFLFSGRKTGSALGPTENWFSANGLRYDYIFMRADNDSRADVDVKREMYETLIKGQYLVWLVCDDRPSVCRDLWVEEGLPLLQFGNPYGEF